MYTKQTKRDLIQHLKVDNMRLSITRIREESRGLSKITCYHISLYSGYRVVFESIESNSERLWYLYDTIFDAMHGRS